jgi:hypothetical protein
VFSIAGQQQQEDHQLEAAAGQEEEGEEKEEVQHAHQLDEPVGELQVQDAAAAASPAPSAEGAAAAGGGGECHGLGLLGLTALTAALALHVVVQHQLRHQCRRHSLHLHLLW